MAGIGDAVMGLPAFRTVKENNKNAILHLLTTPRTQNLIKHQKIFNKIYTFDLNRAKKIQNVEYTIKNISNLIGKLRKQKYDLVINFFRLPTLWGTLRMLFFIKLIGAKKTAGRSPRYKFFDYTYVEENLHEIEKNLKLCEMLGFKIKEKLPQIIIPEEAEERIKKWLYKINPQNKILIGINLGGMKPAYRWDTENYRKLCEEILKKYDAKIILIGAKEDKIYAKYFEDLNVISAIGKFSLIEICALLKNLNLLITHDSGIMHIASALSTPLIALLGPAHPSVEPVGTGKIIKIRKKVKCSPCNKIICKKNICMKKITLEEVLKQVDILIA